MSEKWENAIIQHLFPHRNINLNNYSCPKVPSQELRIPDGRLQQVGNKRTLIEEGRKKSFTLPVLP